MSAVISEISTLSSEFSSSWETSPHRQRHRRNGTKRRPGKIDRNESIRFLSTTTPSSQKAYDDEQVTLTTTVIQDNNDMDTATLLPSYQVTRKQGRDHT